MAQAQNKIKETPAAVDVEQNVLGSCLVEPEALDAVVGRCSAAHFYDRRNALVFDAVCHLFDYDAGCDPLTVEARLKETGQLSVVGSTYLADLTRMAAGSGNITYYIAILENKKLKRESITGFTKLIKKSYDNAVDAYQVLDDAAALIDHLSDGNIMHEGRLVANILPESLMWIEERQKNPGAISGIPSGLDIDSMTGGWQPGDLIILAARPSMGKTALALTAARNAALRNSSSGGGLNGGVIFSLEMSDIQLTNRFISMESHISYENIRDGRVTESELKKLQNQMLDRLSQAQIIIDDSPSLSLRSLKTKVRKYDRRHKSKWVMIDYLQLMDLSDAGDTTDEKIGVITRGLKLLAKELNIPVILLSQLSRAVETRGGSKRPMLSDLRSSGNIEQDADVVIFLYRPEYYDIKLTSDNRSTDGIAEIIIGKQRNGPVGSTWLNFEKCYGEFRNQAYNHQETETQIDNEPGF